MTDVNNYNEICDVIKQLDSKIRFVGIINERGRLVAGGMKEGIQSLGTQKDDEMLFMELVLRVKMRKEFDKQLGPVKFAMASRQRTLEISVPINNDVLYVVTESDDDFCKIPQKILEFISKK